MVNISATKSHAVQGSSPCAIPDTPFAFLHLAAKFFAALRLHQKILPPLHENLAYCLGNIADSNCRNHIVIALNVPVEHAFKVKAVATLAVLIDVFDFGSVFNVAFPTDGRQRTGVGVHRCKEDTRVGDLALNVLGSVVPVDSNRVDRLGGIIVCMQELHDAGKVVWFARGLADEVDVVCEILGLALRRKLF